MDRAIGDEVLRRRRLRKLATGVGFAAAALWILWALPGWLRPSLSRARILTAPVERKTIDAVIEASGVVLPAHEKVLSSPIDTRVVRILKRPGDPVRKGEPLLELDTAAMRLEMERIEDRLAQKRNEQVQTNLRLERELEEFDGRIEKADLDREILQARHGRNLRLAQDGLVSDEELKESGVEARKAAIEADQLRRSADSARDLTRSELDRIALDLGILEKEAAEARHRLDLATTRAEDEGGPDLDRGRRRSPGIAPEVRASLFTPFFSTKRNGRGLGLTIVQEILGQHQFEFGLDSLPGGGAEFRIRFG